MYSTENIQEAESLKRNRISLLQNCSFKLSQWQSNVHEFCEKIDVQSVTALRLEWILIADDFKLYPRFAGKVHSVITQRVVLLVAPSIFNPLGTASPFRFF